VYLSGRKRKREGEKSRREREREAKRLICSIYIRDWKRGGRDRGNRYYTDRPTDRQTDREINDPASGHLGLVSIFSFFFFFFWKLWVFDVSPLVLLSQLRDGSPPPLKRVECAAVLPCRREKRWRWAGRVVVVGRMVQ
jgi:hypothetical protein